MVNSKIKLNYRKEIKKMQEKAIEIFLIQQVKRRNGLAIKLNSTSLSGLPDRLVLLPQGLIFFVELKSPTGRLRPTQKVLHRVLKNLGFTVYVINSKTKVKEVLKTYDNLYTSQLSKNSD